MPVDVISGSPRLSGTATFGECEQLFCDYPLAVTPRCPGGGCRAMVLMNRAAGPAAFFVLAQVRDDLFVFRAWNCQGEDSGQEIRPGEPVPDRVVQVIDDGMPVPHDGAVLGWVADRQVTALMTVHSGHAAAPETDTAAPFPEIRVMPMSGTSELDWPPFTASPLDDGRLWDYLERGQIVDIVPLLTGRAGHAFWVPRQRGRTSARGAGCVVVTGNLPAEEYWLPAGVYTDHWRLREGIPAPPATQLLALEGTVDLALHQAATGAAGEIPAE